MKGGDLTYHHGCANRPMEDVEVRLGGDLAAESEDRRWKAATR